jgi:hypothetical protein
LQEALEATLFTQLASSYVVCHRQYGAKRGELMGLETVEQVRRVFRIVAGFTLLGAGAVMLITPGPGWLTIFLGLGLLAAEFVWAKRLMERIKCGGGRLKDSVFGKAENAAGGEREAEAVTADNTKSRDRS